MNEKPQITTLDEAKAALDEEISSAQSTVDWYQSKATDAKRELEGHERKLWALKSLRRRFDPAPKPTLAAVEDAA